MPNNYSLPTSARTAVFRALVGLFRTDANLLRVIPTLGWHVWTGDRNDLSDLESVMPAIRITPLGEPATPQTQTKTGSPLALSIEIATDGTNADDLLDLWGAVETVVFTGDGARTALQAAIAAAQGTTPKGQVHGLTLSNPAISPQQDKAGNGFMVAAGIITVNITIAK